MAFRIGSDYQEAEPLHPIAVEFGQELVKLGDDQVLMVADIEKLVWEKRFSRIQPYGIVFSQNPKFIVSIRINQRHSFNITKDGQAQWSKK